MTRYYLVHILTIFLVLQVSCQNPEETVIQDNSASEHTLGSNGMSGSMSQDPTSLKRSQMEESTGSIEGFIRDVDGNPIGQATLQIDGSNSGAATALDGSYVLHRIPPGSHRLVVTAPGYRLELSVEILPDSTTEFNVIL
ncbi:MAG: carboxypeptidase-like regulatory domain-containing protein [Bacteroidetes bacterium]|nr:carboxypeptidase-like regulatory domain-containing protein [Bacteroidota bacterium]